MEQLQKGVGVKILTKPEELDRSNSEKWSDSILNSIVKWRKQPLVYAIRTDKVSLINLDQYNSQKQDFNAKNIKWGILLVLFILGRLLWAAFQDRKSTRYNKR